MNSRECAGVRHGQDYCKHTTHTCPLLCLSLLYLRSSLSLSLSLSVFLCILDVLALSYVHGARAVGGGAVAEYRLVSLACVEEIPSKSIQRQHLVLAVPHVDVRLAYGRVRVGDVTRQIRTRQIGRVLPLDQLLPLGFDSLPDRL